MLNLRNVTNSNLHAITKGMHGSAARPHLVLRGDALQEVDVLLAVKVHHVFSGCLARLVRLHHQ